MGLVEARAWDHSVQNRAWSLLSTPLKRNGKHDAVIKIASCQSFPLRVSLGGVSPKRQKGSPWLCGGGLKGIQWASAP